MKKSLIALSVGLCILMLKVVFVDLLYTDVPIISYGIAKGNANDGKKVIVGTTAMILISTATMNINDYIIKNYGPYDIWIDSHSTVEVSGTNEGYRLEVGESISIHGDCDAMLWGKSLTASSTIYVFTTESK